MKLVTFMMDAGRRMAHGYLYKSNKVTLISNSEYLSGSVSERKVQMELHYSVLKTIFIGIKLKLYCPTYSLC